MDAASGIVSQVRTNTGREPLLSRVGTRPHQTRMQLVYVRQQKMWMRQSENLQGPT
eukprot:COSAG02_NODE_14_length_56855_cov_512.793661_7_plen_56_part_00